MILFFQKENVVRLDTSGDKRLQKIFLRFYHLYFYKMINNFSIDSKSKNYLIISSDIKLRYEIVINKICEYLEISDNRILENPDIKYVSLPIIDKSGNAISSLSNKELLMREYGLIDNVDSNRIGNEITIDQIRDIISFTQISAHKSKNCYLKYASNMNREASSALLKTLRKYLQTVLSYYWQVQVIVFMRL